MARCRSRGRTAVIGLLSALACLPWLTADPPAAAKSLHPDHRLLRGGVQQYGHWLVGCDNLADCTMLGIAEPVAAIDFDGPQVAVMAVRISFSGAVEAPPQVELIPIDPAEQVCAAVAAARCHFRLGIGGGQAGRTFGYAHVMLDDGDAELMINGLRSGLKITGLSAATGQVMLRFPESQFGRAFRAVSGRRLQMLRQAGGKVADDLPGRLTRIPASEVMVSGFAPILAVKKCRGGQMRNTRRFKFATGAELWSYACPGKDASGERTFWEMAAETRIRTAPLTLPEPREGQIAAGAAGLQDASFEWDFGILRSVQYRPGRKDCGTSRAWGFTGNGWIMLERREMPLCLGLAPENWIRTHFTATDGARPDE